MASKEESTYSLKKEAKNFDLFGGASTCRVNISARRQEQKCFGSFFQKITSSFAS
jgi:hypothetical protein